MSNTILNKKQKNEIQCVERDGKYFHINENYEPLYDERYDFVGDFCEGLAIARVGDDSFHITPDGKPAYRQRYDKVGDFNDGIAVAVFGTNYFHINKDGNPAYQEKYNWVECFNEGLAQARIGDGFFHITLDGNPAYSERYDWVEDFHEGLAVARLGGKWFHITRDGKPAYPERYDWVWNFQEGFAVVWSGDKYFHITHDFKPAYNQRYDWVGRFRAGLAPARLGNEEFYINKQGERIDKNIESVTKNETKTPIKDNTNVDWLDELVNKLQELIEFIDTKNNNSNTKPITLTEMKDKKLKKDLVIPKGTVFSSISPGTKHEYCSNDWYELVFGLSDNTSGSINYCIEAGTDKEKMIEYFEDI